MGRSLRDGTCTQRIAYSALPSQQAFHRCTERFKGFSGPVGSGKSQALCQEAIRLAYVNAGRVGLIGAPTYAMLRDATVTSLLEILEENEIPYDYNKSENVLTFRDTRSRVLFRSLEEFERLRGTNLAWFGVDELTYCAEEAWLRLEARLRDPKATRLTGFAAWTPKGFDWVYRRFISEPVAGYRAILAKPMENRFLLDRVPDFYERLRGSYDERFFQQEVLGQYLSINTDLVYHAFRRDLHVRDAAVQTGRPLLWALDFNVDPMCSVVAQMDRDTVQVLDEIVLSRVTTEQACEEFYRRFRHHPGGLIIYGDASGNRAQTTGTSDYQMVRQFFARVGYRNVEYKVPASNPAVRERVMLVNARFRNAAGEVRMQVSPRCKELIKDFEQVAYKGGSTAIDKDRDLRRTHLSDALGYLIWQESVRSAPIGPQPKRLF